MKRSEHLFQFTGEQIGNAARERATYHNDRLVWWTKEAQVAEMQAKDAQVTTREYPITGGKRVELVIDEALSKRLSECASKIQTHRAASERFSIEAGAYLTQKARTFELHPDDIVYFHLAGGVSEE